MFFTPVIRRAAYTHAPRSADLALQRFDGHAGATAEVVSRASQRATPLPRMTNTTLRWMCPVCHASN